LKKPLYVNGNTFIYQSSMVLRVFLKQQQGASSDLSRSEVSYLLEMSDT
jgi:hypothetical protein